MSDAVAALAAGAAAAVAFRARIMPLFAPGSDVPWALLRVIDGLLENGATARDWRTLARAVQQGATGLRLLEQWRAMASFQRLADELDREAERVSPSPSPRSIPDAV